MHLYNNSFIYNVLIQHIYKYQQKYIKEKCPSDIHSYCIHLPSQIDQSSNQTGPLGQWVHILCKQNSILYWTTWYLIRLEYNGNISTTVSLFIGNMTNPNRQVLCENEIGCNLPVWMSRDLRAWLDCNLIVSY